MRVRLTDLLGIEVPIIQGAMARLSTAELVSAVSEAGALGVLTSVGVDAAGLDAEIRRVKQRTSRPFGVNLMLQQPNIAELLPVLYDERPAVVTTGAGTPKAFAHELQAHGIKLLPVVPSVKHAKKMAALGVDAVIVEGQAAGGHVGRASTLPLVQQVTQAVDIPVIAAGGIGTGQAIAAMACLGASGVQIGTLFLAATECNIGPNYRAALVQADDQATIVTGSSAGDRVRSLANDWLRALQRDEFNGLSNAALEQRTRGSYQRALADDLATGSALAGESAGLIRETEPAAAIIARLMTEYRTTIKDMRTLWREF